MCELEEGSVWMRVMMRVCGGVGEVGEEGVEGRVGVDEGGEEEGEVVEEGVEGEEEEC